MTQLASENFSIPCHWIRSSALSHCLTPSFLLYQSNLLLPQYPPSVQYPVAVCGQCVLLIPAGWQLMPVVIPISISISPIDVSQLREETSKGLYTLNKGTVPYIDILLVPAEGFGLQTWFCFATEEENQTKFGKNGTNSGKTIRVVLKNLPYGGLKGNQTFPSDFPWAKFPDNP